MLPGPIVDRVLRALGKGIQIPGIQTFATAGAYTWSKDGVYDYVLTIVTGSGAGGRDSDGAGTDGGGGSGGVCKIEIIDVRGTTSETVTVGAAGAKNTNGNTSSFGAHVTSSGGLTGDRPTGGASNGKGSGRGGDGGPAPEGGTDGPFGESGTLGAGDGGGEGGGSYGDGGDGGVNAGAAPTAGDKGGGGGGAAANSTNAEPGGAGIVIVIPLYQESTLP